MRFELLSLAYLKIVFHDDNVKKGGGAVKGLSYSGIKINNSNK